jgi:hypothetical protein
MSKKLFFFGVAALLSVLLFMFGCPTGSTGSGRGAGSNLTPAGQLAANLNAAAGGGNKATVGTDGTTVTLGDNATISRSITVPAGVTLAVAAGKTLTMGFGGSIVLIGASTNPAKLVLENNVGQQVADGGGGKLVFIGVSNSSHLLGNSGNITVVKNQAHLTATGNTSGDVFTFAGQSTVLDQAGITGISTNVNGFKSIVAATTTSANMGANGKVIFKAAGSGTATISAASQAKSET